SEPIPFRYWWGLTGCAALMGLVFALAPYDEGFVLAPDRGNWWYAWQLLEPTAWSRLSAWIPYLIHQISIWFLIYQAQQVRPKYIFGLHSFNVWALGINAFFILVHLAQTKLFYDGLAQDMHEATSFMSVVVMLFMIYIMENRRRGFVFGKSVPLKMMDTVAGALRRYHGYYFSWAIIYVFWYHPFEMTSGHLAGFGYMFLLLLQSSLFFTRYHTNRVWTMFLETLFLVHGALVAAFIMNPGEHQFWSMFLFGGVAIFLVTHLHGMGLSTRSKLIVATPLVLILAAFYGFYPQYLSWLGQLPFTMYVGSIVLAVVLWLFIRFGVLIRQMLEPSGLSQGSTS
ncbi:MAG: hypothetical protein ACR2QG_05935, partial [Gammaproteobacteria bacterium]